VTNKLKNQLKLSDSSL